MEKILVKTKELSRLISVSPYMIRKHVRDGLFRAYSLSGGDYLFDLQEILEIIKNKPVC